MTFTTKNRERTHCVAARRQGNAVTNAFQPRFSRLSIWPLGLMAKIVGVVAKKDSKEIAQAGKQICEIIQKHGLLAIPELCLARAARIPGGRSLTKIRADLLVPLHGSDTVL